MTLDELLRRLTTHGWQPPRDGTGNPRRYLERILRTDPHIELDGDSLHLTAEAERDHGHALRSLDAWLDTRAAA